MRPSAWPSHRLVSIVMSGTLVVGLHAASAQEATQEAEAVELAPESLTLEPIVVYGARNATTLDDTTASVGLATAEDIELFGVSDLEDSFRMMGNVTKSGANDSGFIIRGVNSEGFTPGGAPLATLYIDGVQQTTNGARRGARGTWDMEQVEVYRGPQSTLQGRAALAGAIFMKTKDPTYDWEAKAQTEIGTGEHYGGAATVNAPLIADQVALRVSAEYETSENDISYPFYETASEFADFLDDEYFQIRGKLLIQPHALPDTQALLSYSFAHDSPFSNTIGGPAAANLSGGLVPGPAPSDFDADRGDYNYPFLQYVENREADNHNAGLEITHDVSDDLRLTSLSTFSKNITDRGSLNAGAPFDEAAYLGGVFTFFGTGACDGVTFGDVSCFADASLEGEQDFQIFTQDLRANYDNGSLRAVAGLYFAKEDSDLWTFANGDVSNLLTVGAPEEIRGDFTSDGYNVAGYGEVNYEVIPSWRLIAGGRVDHTNQEDHSVVSRRALGSATVGVTDTVTSFTETVFLPKLGIVKEFGDDHSIGFTYQHGFRKGGAGISVAGVTYVYDPEFTTNYELSYRGRFADGRLTLGANAFYQEWEDQQIEVRLIESDPRTAIVENAAQSNSYGFELDGRWRATDALSVFASVGYAKTEIEEYVDAQGNDYAGSAFPKAPEWNIAVGAAYQDPSGVFVAADAEYSSDALSTFGGDDTDSHTVVNAQLGYKLENFSAAIYAKNAFDERYYSSINGDSFATLGDRGEYGLRLGVKF